MGRETLVLEILEHYVQHIRFFLVSEQTKTAKTVEQVGLRDGPIESLLQKSGPTLINWTVTLLNSAWKHFNGSL